MKFSVGKSCIHTCLLLILFLLLFWQFFAQAAVHPRTNEAKPLVITRTFSKQALDPYLEYFVDTDNRLSLTDILLPKLSQKFKPLSGKSSFGYTRAAVWFRMTAVNHTGRDLFWYLEHKYPVIDEIDCYLPTPNGYLAFQSGDQRPFTKRPINFRTSVFPIQQGTGPLTLYIRIHSAGAVLAPLVAWSPEAFERHKNLDLAFNWVYYGIMLATIFYNFFIFLSVRETSYLYLIIFIAGSSLYTMTHSGMTFQQFWPQSTDWANICHPIFGIIGLTGSLFFTRSFLNTRDTTPRWDRILMVLAVAGIVLLAAPFILEYHYATQAMAIFGSLCALTMISTGGLLLYQGLREARFFMCAWAAQLLATLLMFSRSYNILPSNAITDSGVQIGTGFLVVILSFGLADKINTIRREREKALEDVKQSEKRYRLLAENVQDVIWTMDMDTLRITYITPSVERFRGFTPQEAMELTMAEMLTPESRELAMKTLLSELEIEAGGEGDPDRSNTLELAYKHKNGSVIWAEVTTTFIRDAGGHPMGIVGVTRDITNRVAAENEKKRLEAQLRQATKMEAIGTLAGGIAHDFNNILSAIMGYVEICLHETPKNGKIAERLRRILAACERARELVRQILTFSRQDDEKRVPIHINLVVREVLKLIRASLPSTISIRKQLSPDDSVIKADPTHIHQVIMNLCSNAADAMGESGGTLSVSIDTVDIDPDTADKHLELEQGAYVRLTVSDTGNGILPEMKDRIFEPFFTTKEKGKGTGMGLALVHGIVKNLGGAVYVYSEPKKGTTFHIFLPKHTDAKLIPETTDTIILTGNEHILYVDDEEFIVDMAAEMLGELGYRVTPASTSPEALDLFKQAPDQFDLIITDQTMPDLTGTVLAREARSIRADIPIILCTGFTDSVDPDSITSLGISEYMLKPYSKLDISRIIRKVLDSMGKQQTAN